MKLIFRDFLSPHYKILELSRYVEEVPMGKWRPEEFSGKSHLCIQTHFCTLSQTLGIKGVSIYFT